MIRGGQTTAHKHKSMPDHRIAAAIIDCTHTEIDSENLPAGTSLQVPSSLPANTLVPELRDGMIDADCSTHDHRSLKCTSLENCGLGDWVVEHQLHVKLAIPLPPPLNYITTKVFCKQVI